jgi:hypothetical protein
MINWNYEIYVQYRAIEEAKRTGKPVDDGCGTRAYPPGSDGIPIVGPTPTSEKAK